jgi:hypothetical protein
VIPPPRHRHQHHTGFAPHAALRLLVTAQARLAAPLAGAVMGEATQIALSAEPAVPT